MGISKSEKQSRKYVVYILRCPMTRLVRYVGMTSNPKARAACHITSCDGSSQKVAWIARLKYLGLKPLFEIKTPEMTLVSAECLERRLILAFSLNHPYQLYNGVLVDAHHGILSKITTQRCLQRKFTAP